ncbi:MAG: hypothetical protein ABW201_18260 [Candidatus Thiodiazotropha sp.]
MDTGEVIARYVDFRTNIAPLGIGSSDLSDYKFWMYKDSCESDYHSKGLFNEFHHFIKFKEEIKL